MSTATSRKSPAAGATTFSDHVSELRTRLMLAAGVFLLACIAAYIFRSYILQAVLSPIGDTTLVYLTPGGGFNFIFSIILYSGLVISAPFFVYQIYQFVKPTLPEKAKRYSWRVFLASVVLMLVGVLFAYFVCIPASLTFLTNFASEYVDPNLTADSYLNFFVAYVAGLALMFQLPLLLMFWNWISPIKKGGLLSSQRYVIAGSFIVAAIITPTPDALNQIMLAAPVIAVYQLGVVAVYRMNRKARKKEAKQQARVKRTEQPTKRAVTAPAPAPPRPTHKPVLAAQPKRPVAVQPVAVQPKPAHRMQPTRRSIDSFTPMTAAVKRERTPTPAVTTRPHHRVRSVDGMSMPRRPGVPTYQRKSLT